MLGLKDACIHPTTKKPYIQMSVGGRDNSPEGHQVVILQFPKYIIPVLTPPGRLLTWIRVIFRKRTGSKILSRARSSASGICKELGGDNTKYEGRGRFTWCVLAMGQGYGCFSRSEEHALRV